jgi:hypothetical protein
VGDEIRFDFMVLTYHLDLRLYTVSLP